MAQQELKVNISGDSSKLNSALSLASSKLSAFGSKMQSVGKSMTTKLTLPLVAVGGAAVKMAFDFDKSMTSIQALVGVGAEEVAKMGDAAKRMAVDTGKSANEAAEALFFITSAGLRGSEAMDVLNASLKASAVGLGETKTIADLSTSALNAYGSENLSASEATDILTAAVREGKLEASQLAGSMGGVIPIASNMGVSFNEVAASMAAMSRTGTNAAEGATQLNAILMSLQKPAAQSEQILGTLGLSFKDLEKSVSQDGLLTTLINLKESLKGTSVTMTDLFPNTRALKGVLDLTGAGAEANRQIFDALNNTMGATDEAFEKTSKSASFKMTKGLNAMKSSLLAVGQVILTAIAPAVEKLGAFFTRLSEKFSGLSGTTKKIIIAFVGIVAALGPVIAIIGTLLTMAPAIGAAFTLMMGPIGLIIAGLALVAVIIAKNWAPIKGMLLKVGNYFIDLYNNALPIQIAVKAIIFHFKNLLAVGKFIFKSIITVFKAFGKAALGILGGVGDLIMGIFTLDIDQIKKGFSGIGDALSSGLTDGIDGIKANAKELAGTVVDNFNDALKSKKIEHIKVEAEVAPSGEGDSEVETEKKKNTELLQVLTDGQAKRREAVVGNSLEMAGIQDVMNEAETVKILENNAANAQLETQDYEGKKQRFLGFMMSQEEAAARMQQIGSAIDSSFGAIGNSITNMFGGAQSATGAFVGTLAKDALQILGHNLKIAMSGGVTAATETSKSFGPAAAFVLPALIAGATALISGSFAKFADGGIVSGPTMGLVGEYPGARSNPEVIAPLNKLQGMIGSSGGSQNINIGGQIRLEGQDLLIAIERANETGNRMF